MDQNKSKCSDAHEALDVELDQPATSLPVEALPGINEAHGSGATQSLGHNLSTERAVKRHGSVLVLGQDGGLDADLSDKSRHAQEERAGHGDEEKGDATADKASPHSSAVRVEFVAARLLGDAEEVGEADGDVERDVRHGSSDGSREGENLPLLQTANAAPEADVAWGGDDLVGPSSVQVRGRGTSDGGDDDKAERQDAGKDGLEKLHGPAHGDGVDHLVAETPPACKLAALGDEMPDGAADRRGDGLLVDKGDGGTGLEKTLLLILGGRLVGVGNGDGGGGGFNHGEYGQDIGKCVLDLWGVLAVTLRRIEQRRTGDVPG